jgi:hypothetical protein
MISTYLATVLGWYLVIISLFFLCRHEQVKAIALDIFAQRGLFFVVAIITLILGLLMVASHNIWVMGWPVIVTLFAWLTLLSGILRLVCPEAAMRMGRNFIEHPTRMKVTAVVLLIIGLFLLWQVY